VCTPSVGGASAGNVIYSDSGLFLLLRAMGALKVDGGVGKNVAEALRVDHGGDLALRRLSRL
jgi:hypothetical protein